MRGASSRKTRGAHDLSAAGKGEFNPMKTLMMVCLLLAFAVRNHAGTLRPLARSQLLDKIRGAWAGQMIGVSYGAPTEFRFQGKMIEGPIKSADIGNAIDQDDLYVEMTFARVMDTMGLDATTEQYGEAFRDSRYELWHANAGARRNLARGLKAPLSGDPRYNLHCDDIDFQIESDFIGTMCPGLPRAANHFAGRVGRVMNHGDGLYGGMFIAGMYAAAFFEKDPRRVVEAGLASIPPGSAYAAVIRDVLDWSRAYPEDWRQTWQRLQDKWDRDDICPDGFHQPFNIDAKLNGGYVALGLLYGGGDWDRTLEIATRCGQDSDCNPSSAAGILGTIAGFQKIPEKYRNPIGPVADAKFSFTEYSFNTIVSSTERRALAVIERAGGKIDDEEVLIPVQAAEPPPLELSGYGRPAQLISHEDAAWKWQEGWAEEKNVAERDQRSSRVARHGGAVATLEFTGTGVGLVGELTGDGGRADVFLDGVKCELVADAYIGPNTHDDDLWRITGLAPGKHTLRVVTQGKADPRSSGQAVRIGYAITFQ
jgi:hypothetical protein